MSNCLREGSTFFTITVDAFVEISDMVRYCAMQMREIVKSEEESSSDNDEIYRLGQVESCRHLYEPELWNIHFVYLTKYF